MAKPPLKLVKPPVESSGFEDIGSIDDVFLVGDFLGRGSFGEVHSAQYKNDLGKEIALKEINPKTWGQGENTRRKDLDLADREVSSWRTVQGNRHFPDFYGAYQTQTSEGNRWYLALEKIEGKTISEKVRELVGETGKGYSSARAREIILDVARGVGAVHGMGQIIRDLSGSNVMVTDEGDVKLTDIGFMKPTPEDTEDNCSSSTTIHTPGYTGPEALIGDYSEQTDLHALGALWAELISGMNPKRLMSRETSYIPIIRYTLPDQRDNAIFQKLIKPSPEQRPESIREVIDYLEQRVSQTMELQLPEQKSVTNTWDVPTIEATIYATSVMHTSRDTDKLVQLQNYLNNEPVSKRDVAVINGTIKRIMAEESNTQIRSYLQTYNDENPELIFGFSREEIKDLYNRNKSSSNLTDITDENFKQIIEQTSAAGMSVKEIDNLLGSVDSVGRRKIKLGDKNSRRRIKRYLNLIKKGKLDEDVNDLKQRCKVDYFSERLDDPRYQAMALFLEEEGVDLTTESQSVGGRMDAPHFGDERYFNKESSLPVVLGGGFFAFVGGILATCVGGIMAGSSLDPAPVMEAITYSLPAQKIIGGIYAAAVGAHWGKNNLMIPAQKRLTRDKPYYSINISHHRADRLERINGLLKSLPPSEYTRIPEEIKLIEARTEGPVTPYRVLDEVKENIVGYLEAGVETPLLEE